MTDRTDQIKDLIAKEIRYWVTRQSYKCWTGEEKIKLHGAASELLMHAGFPEKITAEYLRERYKMKRARIGKHTMQNRGNDLVAMNRAVKACAAIVRLAKRVILLDKGVDKKDEMT